MQFRRWFMSDDSDAEVKVTVTEGTRIDTVFSCINVLAQDISSLPYNIRQDSKTGKKEIKNDIYRLIHTRPNQYTSASNFWYFIIHNMLSEGNGYAYIKRNPITYRPKEVIQLASCDVTPLVFEGGIYYSYRSLTIPAEDMLHYKLYSFDGILGVSPIVWNANTFGYRIKQQKYQAKALGQKPPGILSFDQNLTTEQREQNRKMWKDATTGDRVGETPVLSNGAKYQQMMISPSEGQMIEAAELNDERICGIYRIPPALVQNYKRATFSNAEQQDLVYVKYAITPILTVIEQETDFKLFTEKEKASENPPYTFFNLKGILRGDIRTQTEFYKFLRSYGIASANQILDIEDMPRLEGDQGDIVVIQGAYIPLDMLKDFYKGKSDSSEPAGQAGSRQIGFEVQKLKEALEKIEIMNQHS
jgi:HK97 family phage portal protein